MSELRIAKGLSEDGIVVGNSYDKYSSRNPIVRRIMRGFDRALSELVDRAAPDSIHEVGCGEGYWTLRWLRQGLPARGSDFSGRVVELARANARAAGFSPEVFSVRSIYDLEPGRDSADLVVCCEVLEHVEDPVRALRALSAVAGRHVILSVPREPLWRLMNMARGRYLGRLGNTPGHVQHWSTRAFLAFVSEHLGIVAVRAPLPWTMVLCRRR